MKRLLCLASYCLAWVAYAAPQGVAPEVRAAVIIGTNEGSSDDEPLEYAEADARRVHQLLVEAGQVAPERAYLVLGGDAQAARRALAEARGRLAELAGRAPTALIIYVSSHADEQALHLAGSLLPVDEVHQLLRDAPATFRLAIIDACRTKVRVHPKGGSPGPPVAVSLVRPAQVEGAVMMMAAGDGEPAQELPYLRGSLFTHHLLTGLRGMADVNQDGSVSLAEAYAYAYGRTVVASASSSAGAQRPSFDMQLSGWGEWSFSRPARFGATLGLSETLGGKVWVSDERQDLVSEFSKPRGESTLMSMKPGWYRVVMPDGQFARVADVNLAWGGTRVLHPGDFERVPLERARLRGAEPIVLRPWLFMVGAGGATGRVPGEPFAPLVELSAARRLGPVFARARFVGSRSQFRGQALTISQLEAGLALGVGVLVPVWRLLLGAGLEAQALGVWQAITRDDADQVQRVFGVTEPVRSDVIWAASVFGVARLPLGDRFWLSLEVAGTGSRVPQLDGHVQVTPSLDLRAGVGITL